MTPAEFLRRASAGLADAGETGDRHRGLMAAIAERVYLGDDTDLTDHLRDAQHEQHTTITVTHAADTAWDQHQGGPR